MRCRLYFLFAIALLFAAAQPPTFAANSDSAASRPIAQPTSKQEAQYGPNTQAWAALQTKALDDLKSNDTARATAAYTALYRAGEKMTVHRERPLVLLTSFKRSDMVEQMAADWTIADPASTAAVAANEKYRVQAFLAEHRFAEALSAARSYYDVAALKDSSDAITLVGRCLALGKTDDPTAAKRFKRQQIAWASADPASQPSAAVAPAPSSQPAVSLGEPVLPTIPPDAKPFVAAASAGELLEYGDFVSRGNLLLLCGKAADARGLFERAEALAPDNKAAEAIENVARAIRAEAGCVGPANAYVLQMRNEQQ